MQRKIAASLLCIHPNGLEEPRDFMSRRNRLSSDLCRRMGWWSDRWWRRCCEWDAHIRRERNSYSWCHALVQWHDGAWLAQRRAEASGNSTTTSRTRTRAAPGHPNQRWDDGITLASSGTQGLTIPRLGLTDERRRVEEEEARESGRCMGYE
eukprot:gnl/TRDRNA2_/TRDRNA2_206283_c0_seq1.p1 gnl/TRDRNA2_/TRDRNA2_206283_c0~~gnl/TRDRNA2_/TRDRNA2_206283_c0_seq1.p1  ORF type:complete len:175 (+),score=15.31 gnl/TRDRNA2_/TRDRNA2_206283_c0_seq1:72-527(+)